MSAAPQPADEVERLRALRGYRILDSAPEPTFDDIARLSAQICRMPIATISLLDETREWFKSRVGVSATEVPRELTFCAHAILGDTLMEIPNALDDGRFADNPLVIGGPLIRFYAGAPLVTPEGRSLGTLCVMDRRPRQLTGAQRNALRTLSHQVMMQLELRRHIVRLEEVMRERDRIEQHKAELVATVTHELRTPLTSIHGSLGLLASGAAGRLPDDAREIVDVAALNTTRLIALINDILDLERLDSDGIRMQMASIDGAAIIHRALESVSGFAAQHGIGLEVQAPPVVVWGDDDRLVQVLINLISNAVKFSPPEGTVTIAVASGSAGVEFQVRDRGRGIPDGMRDAIFQRFRQVSTSDSRQKGGTGLGLAICKAIVERHQGTIGVDSQEGLGSTFWFRVPVPPTA